MFKAERTSNAQRNVKLSAGFFLSTLAALLLAGCSSGGSKPAGSTAAAATPPSQAAGGPAPAPAPAPIAAAKPIRIKCGVDTAWTDKEGNVWQPDTNLFADGEVATRDDSLAVAGTTDPAMFRSERYGMTSFTYKNLPNGKYKVNLYFADTYEGITGAGQRVFSFNVQGQDVKDFDIIKEVGSNKADIKSFDVAVTDGKLNITFTANVENPEINAIEIIPE